MTIIKKAITITEWHKVSRLTDRSQLIYYKMSEMVSDRCFNDENLGKNSHEKKVKNGIFRKGIFQMFYGRHFVEIFFERN